MFDPTAAQERIARLWRLNALFGEERGMNRVLLDEMVSDRMQLLSGLQVLRDELQFAQATGKLDREACSADFTLPSVVTTLAFTNCGDRIHQGEVEAYKRVVGSRFATISEIGVLKPEAFSPTGGGTDDGGTLAHVTWAHQLDEGLRKRIYGGNPRSYVLCAFDLKTHVGRLDLDDGTIIFGKTQESSWREPRAACGAIVGALARYDEKNDVHRRIRSDLGEHNFEFLSRTAVRAPKGIEITAAVAAAIVSVQGMIDTARALEQEMDERGVAHLTAAMTVNRPAMPDTVIYLARATVFGGVATRQGLGTDATKYSGQMVDRMGDRRLVLRYEDQDGSALPIEKTTYTVRRDRIPHDPFA